LNGRVPLIGFSGSPWTLAAYMVDGRGSQGFPAITKLMAENPTMLHVLLEKIATSVAAYLSAQIEAGAQAVQIFDTWGGILPKEPFLEYSLQYIEQVIAETRTSGAPVIVFCKDCSHPARPSSSSARTAAILSRRSPTADAMSSDWTRRQTSARPGAGSAAAWRSRGT
jgi:uroporphyrinogen-III decarboxylase